MVVTLKPNAKVRVCVDLTKLKEYVQRENHPLPFVDLTLEKLARCKFWFLANKAGRNLETTHNLHLTLGKVLF